MFIINYRTTNLFYLQDCNVACADQPLRLFVMEGLRDFGKAYVSGGFHHLASSRQAGGGIGTGLNGDINALGGEIDHLEEDLTVRGHVLCHIHSIGAVLRFELADLRLSRHTARDVLKHLAVGVGFKGEDVPEVVGPWIPQLGVVDGGEGAINAAHLQGCQGDGGSGGGEGGGRCGGGAGDGGGSGRAGGGWGGAGGRRAGSKGYHQEEEEKNFLVHKLNFARNMPKI